MSYISGYQGNLNPALSTTIANAGTESAVINCGGLTLCGIFIPGTFDGTSLTFLVSPTVDGTYVPLKSTTSGTALTYTIAVSGYYALNPADFQGVNFIKLKTGSTQSGARTVICSLKGI